MILVIVTKLKIILASDKKKTQKNHGKRTEKNAV